jgi:hypothetical protein
MKQDKATLEVSNIKKGFIYKADLTLTESAEGWGVYRHQRRLSLAPQRTEALILAAEKVLEGFKEPSLYTAFVDGVPYVQREVLKTKEAVTSR